MRHLTSLCAALLAVGSLALPALAGPAENAALAKYIGSWSGSGKVTGSQPGNVSCKLVFRAGTAGKLNYSGRCSFADVSMAGGFTGSIGYSDAHKRYEATTYAQGMSGTTAGTAKGGSIIFSSADTKTAMGAVSSTLVLAGSSIRMSFKLTDTGGDVTASSVTFSKAAS